IAQHWSLAVPGAVNGAALLFADVFPRGPGFYFSLTKIGLVVLVYFAWVRTCAWVNQDVHDLGLPEAVWNPVMLGAGVLGLVLVGLFAVCWRSFLLLVIVYLASSLAYRNTRAAEGRQDRE